MCANNTTGACHMILIGPQIVLDYHPERFIACQSNRYDRPQLGGINCRSVTHLSLNHLEIEKKKAIKHLLPSLDFIKGIG